MRLATVTPIRPPSAEIIGELEAVLNAAKAGQLLAVGIAAVTIRNKSLTTFAGTGPRSTTCLIGGVAKLQHQIMSEG